VGGSNVKEKELLLSEYQALSKEEKNNDTNYYITDADNISDVNSVGTAGSLKPWLYDSDEEVVVGIYNGKPLYRKTLIYENYMVSTGRNELPFEIENIDMIVNSYGYITNSIHTSVRPINTHVTDSNGDSLYYVIYFTDKYIYLQSNDTWSSPNICFTIEYTKTTDAENSGTNLMPYTYVQNVGVRYNYSTEEQIVGTWIDGRPIYQKTITDYDIISTTNKSVLVSDNIDIMIKPVFGYLKYINAIDSSIDITEIPYHCFDASYIINANLKNGYINIEKGGSINTNNYSYIVATMTFQYTKTTD
jgi:hypothetical protein